MIKMDDKAEGGMNPMMLYLVMMFLMFFLLGNEWVQTSIKVFGDAVFYPLIGFGGKYPMMTIILAGTLVVLLSGFFQNLFTNWWKMGENQELSKSFQKEMGKARKEGNTNRVNKLMKMQPKIMKKQTESQSDMMKPMMFLFIFIVPIFIWLRSFLGGLDYFFFTTPWSSTVSYFESPILWQNWMWIYLIFSYVVGSIIRSIFKYLKLSGRFFNFKGKKRGSY